MFSAFIDNILYFIIDKYSKSWIFHRYVYIPLLFKKVVDSECYTVDDVYNVYKRKIFRKISKRYVDKIISEKFGGDCSR